MSNREIAINIVKVLPEEKIKAFLELFADENLMARIETDIIGNDLSREHYHNFSEILEEIDNEV